MIGGNVERRHFSQEEKQTIAKCWNQQPSSWITDSKNEHNTGSSVHFSYEVNANAYKQYSHRYIFK